MILLLLTLCMVIFMMIFIVPRITEAFGKAGTDLPGMTQMVVNISNFFIHDWPKLLIALIVLMMTVKAIKLTYTGQVFFATLAFHAPIF